MTDSPSIDFCGVRVFAVRDGDRVTGHVEFPYECNGRTRCPIDYRSQRPELHQNRDREGATLDERAAERLRLVRQWQGRCQRFAGTEQNKEAIAKGMLAKYSGPLKRVGYRTLQNWARKLDTEGPDGLRDRYVKPPRKVLTIDAKHAKDAALVCAWWAFRIGNCECIDTKMMALASEHLVAPGYLVADLLATIDCYYSWPTNRTCYAFKPFARWTRHDFPAPWLYRACDQNDYRRGLQAAKKEHTPLLAPATMMSPTVVDAAMRKREVLHQPTRRAIRDLSPVSEGQSQSPSEPVSNTLRSADTLRAVGCHNAARQVIERSAPGIPAMAANPSPHTIAEALGTLDDGYRVMLHKAAQGDSQARKEALATLPLWWERMPEAIRTSIDFRVETWRSNHPRATDRAVASRKLLMLLAGVRGSRSGAHRLFPAARIPV